MKKKYLIAMGLVMTIGLLNDSILADGQIEYNEKGERIQVDSTVRKVIIDEGISTIGRSAFASSSIEEIVIPSSMRSIEDSAFSGCTKLKSLTIPSAITYIGQIFYGSDQPDEIVFEGSNPPSFSTYGIVANLAQYDGTIGTLSTKIKVPKGSEEKYLDAICNSVASSTYYSIDAEAFRDVYKNAIVGY